MPTLTLSNEQVIELVKQLSPGQQEELLQFLLTQQWDTWVDLSRRGEPAARQAAAQRGQSWDTMTEHEREELIDDVVHEDRRCAG